MQKHYPKSYYYCYNRLQGPLAETGKLAINTAKCTIVLLSDAKLT